MRRRRGGGLVAVLIVLALIGAGVYYFFVHKKADQEGDSHGAVEQAAAQAGMDVEEHPAAGEDLKTNKGRAVMKERIEANMKAKHDQRMKNIPK